MRYTDRFNKTLNAMEGLQQSYVIDRDAFNVASRLLIWFQINRSQLSTEDHISVGLLWADYPDAHWIVSPVEYGLQLPPNQMDVIEDRIIVDPIYHGNDADSITGAARLDFRTSHSGSGSLFIKGTVFIA